MAELSDLFGRKGEPRDGGPAQHPTTNGNGGRHISLENYSDVGLRIDEENEVHALTPAEEKIAALGERNAHLEADVQVNRTNIEKRVEELHAALQHERM